VFGDYEPFFEADLIPDKVTDLKDLEVSGEGNNSGRITRGIKSFIFILGQFWLEVDKKTCVSSAYYLVSSPTSLHKESLGMLTLSFG
jgi:hypothetical protein